MKNKPTPDDFAQAEFFLSTATKLLRPVLEEFKTLRDRIEDEADAPADRFTILTIAIVVLQAKLEAILHAMPLQGAGLAGLRKHITEDVLAQAKEVAGELGHAWHD